jgi:hypothetical protein
MASTEPTPTTAGTTAPATGDDSISALGADLSRTARLLFSAGSVDDTLTQVLALAGSTIEGCDFAGIVLLDSDTATTPAHTVEFPRFCCHPANRLSCDIRY